MNTDKDFVRNPRLSAFIRGQFALLFCCAALHAQTFPSDPRAKKAIDDAVAALGGERFLTMQDRVESGRAYSFYRNQISGLSIATIYTEYFAVPPDRTGKDLGVREREVFGKTEEYGYTLLRENGAWEVTYKGPRELEEDRVTRYQRTTLNDILYILRMRLDEPGMIFDWKGSDVVENQPVNIVDITDSENRTVTVCFGQTSKLPVRQTMVWRDPKTRDRNEEITRYALYREQGGVQWPQQITRDRNGEKIYQIFSDFVLINPGLPDSVFAVPAGPATKTPFKLPKQKP
jgi:hypothetical protein